MTRETLAFGLAGLLAVGGIVLAAVTRDVATASALWGPAVVLAMGGGAAAMQGQQRERKKKEKAEKLADDFNSTATILRGQLAKAKDENSELRKELGRDEHTRD